VRVAFVSLWPIEANATAAAGRRFESFQVVFRWPGLSSSLSESVPLDIVILTADQWSGFWVCTDEEIPRSARDTESGERPSWAGQWVVGRFRATAPSSTAEACRCEVFAGRGELRYTGFTPMSRSHAIDPQAKSRGPIPP
jgi:hypothetical protein